MSESFTDFLPGFLNALLAVLKSHNYLIKGGQAIKYHLEQLHQESEARFSKDLDFSFPTKSFPLDFQEFQKQLIEKYNSDSNNLYLLSSESFDIDKMPEDEELYFGVKLKLNIRKKKQNNQPGKKLYFNGIGLTMMVDFAVNEVVEKQYTIEGYENIHFASIPLIISEKFRAICWQLPECKKSTKKIPRPKDFYDIFLLYNLNYKKEVIPEEIILLRNTLEKCFQKKEMDLTLLNNIENERVKGFHEQEFEGQVLQTLSKESIYADVTFDQVYSETLEFLDIILDY